MGESCNRNISEFNHLSQSDECVIIIKAQPHRSSNYFETVCAAGVGRDGKWRRQYPVPFRILSEPQKFRRWNWITYRFTDPGHDSRKESQKVVPESIQVSGTLRRTERARLLNPMVRDNFEEADKLGESLTLIRPTSLNFRWKKKTEAELKDERNKHLALANQLSWLDEPAKPLEPCPYQFTARWKGDDGKTRNHECDDWESSAAFFRFRREHGEEDGLKHLKKRYEDEFLPAGLALAFSTHSRRNITNKMKNQWLLVGLIRLDRDPHGDLFR